MPGTLLTPLRIGSMTVRNRLYRAPVLEGVGDGPDAGDKYAAHFVENAHHGVGMIVQGSTCIAAEGRTGPCMSCADARVKVMRFDLATDGDGTRLQFTLYFMPTDTVEDPYPGGDLPAGPGTAWRPGFLAGFHEFLDDLYGFLKGEWTADDRAKMLADPQASQHALIDAYREHVRDNCPSE